MFRTVFSLNFNYRFTQEIPLFRSIVSLTIKEGDDFVCRRLHKISIKVTGEVNNCSLKNECRNKHEIVLNSFQLFSGSIRVFSTDERIEYFRKKVTGLQ